MADRLYFRYVDSGVEGLVDLNRTNAPVACETLWQALAAPVQVTCLHGMFAGPEIMVGLPESARNFDGPNIPAENQTVIPAAGDCLWFHQSENMMYGLTDELWEIGMFYGDGGRVFGPLGWTPCNIFGRMRENLTAFAAESAAIRYSGAKTLEIGRAPGTAG